MTRCRIYSVAIEPYSALSSNLEADIRNASMTTKALLLGDVAQENQKEQSSIID